MKRSGFGLITAIVFMVVVATLGALITGLGNVSVRQSGNLYLLEQVKLYARSATEYAVMAVQAHDIKSSNNCVNHIDIDFSDTIKGSVDIYYIGKSLPASCNTLSNSLVDSDLDKSIIVDTIISVSKDFYNTKKSPIVYHRRTLQKP
jgi:hypothetical protein